MARMLFSALQAQGVDCRYSFELAESSTGAQELAARPWLQRLLQDVTSGRLAHLHGSTDWNALLAAMPESARLVLTLHDASLLTGGCPFPLDCPHFGRGCVDPCPRNFSDAAARRERREKELRRLKPVLLCPSKWMKEQARSVLPGMEARVLPNGVEWPAVLPSQSTARASLGVSPKAGLAVFVAHGGEEAGYKAGPNWSGIWASIQKHCPQALAFFVGGKKQGREGNLLRWPYLQQEQLRLLLHAADVLVYPSLADNHPLLILEAMAAGCAVVASAVGGIPEQIVHGRTGMLAPAGDFETLAEFAAELLLHPAKARAMGGVAREEGSKRFSSERMVAAHDKVYSSLF